MPSETATKMDIEQAKTLSNEEVLKRLGVTESGLSDEEATERLAQYGPNALVEHRVSLLNKFLSYFWGPIPWMIESAAILSAMVQQWADFSIIVVLLMVNAVIGFYEEYKADNAIQLLKQKLALMARVRRNGQWTTIPAAQLVPGDLARIRLGDIIPADLKLLQGDLPGSGSIRTHRRVLARRTVCERYRVFGFGGGQRRDEWRGGGHRHADLFWQDRPTRAGNGSAEPLSGSGLKDWALPDCLDAGIGRVNYPCGDVQEGSDAGNPPVRLDPDRSGHSRSPPCGALRHDGGGRRSISPAQSYRQSPGVD